MHGSSHHCTPSFSKEKIFIFGDSILRNLEDICTYSHFDFDYHVKYFPGATVQKLRRNIKELFFSVEEDTRFVVLHIGTNNLDFGIWDKDKQYFIELYKTCSEIFRGSIIVFSLILPRWDDELLYIQSLYYNEQLTRLARTLHNCAIFDGNLNADYSTSDFLYAVDGLHLRFLGKCFYFYDLESFVISSLKKILCKCEIVKSTCTRIPHELKRLWTPTKKRKAKKDIKELKFVLRVSPRKKKRRTSKKRFQDEGGYIHPKRFCKPVPPPVLPPNRHIPEKLPVYIPYVNQHERFQHETTTIQLPAPTSPYVARKKKGKRKKRKRQRILHQRKRRKRKVR
nr:uncharacterized protein LOC129270131 [Lytechinus pictus]XP_054767422.1 uncharacterized protein LOC129274679 [Lytechinus pictus]